MATLLGNWFANAALSDYFVNKPVWLALHLTDPGATGDASTEFGGGNYARQRIYFGNPATGGAANKAILNNSSVTFSNLLAATITYFGFWNSVSATNTGFLCSYQLSPALAVTASSQVLVGPNDIAIVLV